MNRRARVILSLLRQFGFDPIVLLRTFSNFPTFIRNYLYFRSLARKDRSQKFDFSISPAMQDRNFSAGQSDGHYFWQDLICARWIYGEPHREHVDVGSRIDGFIAHLLTFMEITLIDIRPLNNSIPGLNMKIADIMEPGVTFDKVYNSVSSLHSIEHFGLGRYGDSLNPKGHEIGLYAVSSLVAEGGNLFLSFPIGKPRIEFDSQRILSPLFPSEFLKDFSLIKFALIPWKGEPSFDLRPIDVDVSIEGQAGLYWLKRNVREK